MIFLNFETSLNASGATNIEPIINLILVKVKGPTYSMPVVCATKAVPQMNAARTRQRVDKNCLEDIKKMAPQVGFEPTTCRLTAECSTAELLRNVSTNYNNFLYFQLSFCLIYIQKYILIQFIELYYQELLKQHEKNYFTLYFGL